MKFCDANVTVNSSRYSSSQWGPDSSSIYWRFHS